MIDDDHIALPARTGPDRLLSPLRRLWLALGERSGKGGLRMVSDATLIRTGKLTARIRSHRYAGIRRLRMMFNFDGCWSSPNGDDHRHENEIRTRSPKWLLAKGSGTRTQTLRATGRKSRRGTMVDQLLRGPDRRQAARPILSWLRAARLRKSSWASLSATSSQYCSAADNIGNPRIAEERD